MAFGSDEVDAAGGSETRDDVGAGAIHDGHAIAPAAEEEGRSSAALALVLVSSVVRAV